MDFSRPRLKAFDSIEKLMPEVLPSLLAADFANLARDIARVEAAGAKMLHFDVMDGHFVPNISMGPPVLAAVRKATGLHLDVHLMITEPDVHARAFVEAGADSISIQQEACPHLDRSLRHIQSLGIPAGVVLNPATPAALIDEVLGFVDFVLVMSVNPGFGGQRFIPETLFKVRRLDALRRERGLGFRIEIDGGITLDNVEEAVRAGVDWIVAGSSIFGATDPGETFRRMTRLAHDAASVRA